MTLARDGKTAVLSDSDRDQVYVVDLKSESVRTIALAVGDEPGRVTEDGAGRMHVVLRRGRAVVAIDTARAVVIARYPVCSAPRGIAYESARDALHVACGAGELVTLAASDGRVLRELRLERDLRDVVVHGSDLLVSQFRSAKMLRVSSLGEVVGHGKPKRQSSFGPSSGNADFANLEPGVAWRMIALPDGAAAVVHQLARVLVPTTSTNPNGVAAYYGAQPTNPGPCSPSIVDQTISVFRDPVGSGASKDLRAFSMPRMPFAVLPVDMAISPDGAQMAVVAAGNSMLSSAVRAFTVDVTSPGSSGCAETGALDLPPGQPVAVAFTQDSDIAIQMREPAQLHLVRAHKTISLSSISREDTGHSIFHANTGTAIACASCHAEGADDGQTWDFPDSGIRRTPSLLGTIADTAPYHWDGALADFPALVGAIYKGRMSGEVTKEQAVALSSWVTALPAPPATLPRDRDAYVRGSRLFSDAAVGCSGCHSGAKLTNNATVSVGTEGAFQVPSLIGVAWRAPYLHTGCAGTLMDRFTACGGTTHGATTSLTKSDLSDLVTFLETL